MALLKSRSDGVIKRGLLLAAVSMIGVCGLAGTASAAYVEHPDISYDLDSPPAVPSLNALDLYVPSDLPATSQRPVVLYVHGGGWIRGDKSNSPTNKARLFTDAGYVYATMNYRLSPIGGDGSDPARVKFPDHPHDVGEAIGWIDRHISEYGGDPGRIIIIGHSAGAHLVSLVGADPRYIEAYGVQPTQLLGVVPLDGIFNVAQYSDPAVPGNRAADVKPYWNVFGTPAENAATNSWSQASPLTFADPGDPPALMVTQQGNVKRAQGDYAMAKALGQDPSSVLLEPLDHEGINDALGSPTDKTGETQAVLAFVQGAVSGAASPVVRIRHRPPNVLRVPGKFAKVSFAFSTETAGARYQCSLDGAAYKGCRSPRAYNVTVRKHAFRVRAYVPGRSHGPTATVRFRVAAARG